MAKKKESSYTDWEDVNFAMKQLAELNIAKNKIENRQTLAILKVKAACEKKAENILSQIKSIEKDIERFAEENKEEFIKVRNKKLTFGVISYKLTKSIKCKNTATAIKSLKALNLYSYIRVKEELDKEALKGLDEQTLTKACMTLSKVDKLTIEPNYVELVSIPSTQ